MPRHVSPGGMESVSIESLFLGENREKIVPMAFAEGQQVRVKQGQAIGVVDRKLTYLQDMYVVLLNGPHARTKKLAHESDLELLRQADERQSA